MPSFAGPWCQPENKHQHIWEYTNVNVIGNRMAKYKNFVSTLAEYGYSDDLTIGIKPAYKLMDVAIQNDKETRIAKISNFEVATFFRQQLYKTGNAVVSWQPTIKFNEGIELRGLAGYNGAVWKRNFYVSQEVALEYNFRYEDLLLYKYDIIFGYEISKDYFITAKLFNYYNSKYKFKQTGQISIMEPFFFDLKVEYGAFYDIVKFTGFSVRDRGATMAIWYSF